MFQKFYHDLAFFKRFYSGTHPIRQTEKKPAILFLTTDIIVSGNLFRFSCKPRYSVKHLITDILHKMDHTKISIYNTAAVGVRRHGASADPGQDLCDLCHGNTLSAPGSQIQKYLPSSFDLIHDPDILYKYMLFTKSLFQIFLKLRICRHDIIQLFCHMIHDPRDFRQLLCNCKPAFDHPVVPHEILPFFTKSLIQDLKILGGTATCSHPFTACSLDTLFIAFLHGTDHILTAPHGFPGTLSPADLSLITSGTYSRTGVRYDTVQLSSAQKFLTVRHSVECIRKFPEGCCISFHLLLLGMAFTERHHLFFCLCSSRKDSFCHVPEYQQYADYEHGNDPFLHIFPSPYNLH